MLHRPLDSAFMNHLGIAIKHAAPGRAELHVSVSPHHRNSDGFAHGGLIATLADSAAGVAVYTIADDSLIGVTTDLHVTYLKPTTEGELSAIAEVVHRGVRFLRIAVNVFQAEHLVAVAGASFMIMQRPRTPTG